MAIDFEALITKQAGEDGNIPAANVSKLASALSSAVGREFVAKERYNAKMDEIETLKSEKQTAEDNATNAGKYKDKYEKEHAAFEAYKADTDAKAKLAEVKAAYKRLLGDVGIDPKRHDVVIKATAFDGMKLDAEGKLEKADELKKQIETDWGDFKVSTRVQGRKVETPPRNDGATMTKADIYAKDDKGRYKMSTAERQKALAEHPEIMNT